MKISGWSINRTGRSSRDEDARLSQAGPPPVVGARRAAGAFLNENWRDLIFLRSGEER